jgi:hypothetical protein
VFGCGVGAAYRIGLDYDSVVSGLDRRALGSSIKPTSIPTAAHLGSSDRCGPVSRRKSWCTVGGAPAAVVGANRRAGCRPQDAVVLRRVGVDRS